jgi:glycosyltransferase involved in cell wall biosynthesis
MLRSLAAQSYRRFELLLIDQNSDDRVLGIIDSLPGEITIERAVASPSLSRALNLGLEKAHGEVVGFPDDDCWYPPDLLQNLSDLFDAHREWDGITMPTADDQGVPSIARWAKRPGRLTPSNLGMRGCSTSTFYRRDVCTQVGFFDETIGGGVGPTPGFDMDYLHRVVRAGFHVEFQPQLVVNHPQTLPGTTDEPARQKRYSYGYGEGSIARKYSLPFWYLAAITGFPLARAIKDAAFGLRKEANLEWTTFLGRLNGWMRTRPAPGEIKEPLAFPSPEPSNIQREDRGRKQAG